MHRQTDKASLAGRRCIVTGLLSAREDAMLRVAQAEAGVARAGGIVVGSMVQRRGVSRSPRPGGAKRLGAPLSARTVLGSGKVAELAQACREARAEVIVFIGTISEGQQRHLAAETACRVVVLAPEDDGSAMV